MKKRLKIICIVCVLLLCGAGISFYMNITRKKTAEKLQDEPPCYKLTVLSPVTGELAYIGEPAKWAVEYAQDIINNEGGINGIPVKVTVLDTEFSTEKVKRFEKEILKQERFFIGPLDAPGTEAGAEDVVENGVPNIAAYSYETVREAAAPYGISYMSDSTEGEIEAVKMWKKLNPDIRTVVILASPSDTSQMTTAGLLEDVLSELDMELLEIIPVELDKNNGMNAVVQALNSKADGYIFLARAEEYGLVVSELRKRGIEEGRRITASFSSFENSIVEQNKATLDDTYIWNKFDAEYEGPEWKKLVRAYQEDHEGKSPDSSVVSDMYNAVMAWRRCIEALDLKPEIKNLEQERQKISQWFYNSSVQAGIQGKYQWIQGKKISSIYYFQFDEEGNRISVYP